MLVYSYVRFSSTKQSDGDSFRRQVEDGDEWIRKHGHTPADIPLHDKGVSAFRGKNKHTGRLRTFLDLIEAGKVAPGSILLVEHLDRLSRQGVAEALPLFMEILNAGVHIAVLRPYEQLYTKDCMNDLVGILIPLIHFYLAFLESKNKSDRLRKAWEKMRADAMKGIPFNRRRPSWVDWNEEDDCFVLNAGADAIKFIFEETANGTGQRELLRKLQEHFAPIGTSGRWNLSFINKVLNDRAVLGERTPKTTTDDGERVPTEHGPIALYYPPVIDEQLWSRAQAAKAKKRKKKGPNAGFINLFTGLLINANDGCAMHIQTTRNKKVKGGYVQRRLVSYGHRSSQIDSDPVSIDYYAFEELFLKYVSEVRIDDLETDGSKCNELRRKEQELEGIEVRLQKLTDELADPENRHVNTLLASAAKLEIRQQAVTQEIACITEEIASAQSLPLTQDILIRLAGGEPEEKRNLRERLRHLISELVDRIYIKPEKHYGRIYAMAQVFFKNGLTKRLVFGPGLDFGTKEQVSACSFGVDLTIPQKARARQIFATFAEMQIETSNITIPETIPEDVGGAAHVFLLTSKKRMNKDSYRVIPSKIRRFVEFVGSTTNCVEINKKLWNRWVEWIKTKSGLQPTTARVQFSRAREFVRWLIDEGKTKPINNLEQSAEKALGFSPLEE